MRLRGIQGLLFLALVLLFVVPSSVRYYTDWLWFRELGYEHVFLRTLNAQLMVFAATFAAVFLFLFLNLRFARGTITRPHVVVGTSPDGRAISVDTGQAAGLALPASVLVALGLGVAGARNWLAWLTFFNGQSFGTIDPLFGRDVAFYVFRLPVWEAVQQQAIIIAVLALIGCGLYYVLSGSFVIEPRPSTGMFPRLRLVAAARRHLGLLGALVFALLVWGTWFDRPNTLLTPANVIFGASYVDVHARLPIVWLTMAVLAAGSALSVLYGFTRRAWPLPIAVAAYLAVSIGGGVYAASLQRLRVLPDEFNRERPYID
jgi:uncharacterized membrane protein (UPF0182 family)